MVTRPSMLVVDDHPGIRECLDTLLRSAGFDVSACGSGESALALLARQRFDGILLDIRMPGISGLEVLARISRLAEPPPVIVISADDTLDQLEEAKRLGAFEFLRKPLSVYSILRSAHRAAERSQTRLAS